jgi:hypothetical protein
MGLCARVVISLLLCQLGACLPDYDSPEDWEVDPAPYLAPPPVCDDETCAALGGTCRSSDGGFVCLLDEPCDEYTESVCKGNDRHDCAQGLVVATPRETCRKESAGDSDRKREYCAELGAAPGLEQAVCVDDVKCPAQLGPQLQSLGLAEPLACDRDAVVECPTGNDYPFIVDDCSLHGEHCSTVDSGTTCTVSARGPAAVEWRSLPAGRFTPSVGLVGGRTTDVAAFEMLRTEVTVGQFGECVRAGGCHGSFGCDPSGVRGDMPLACLTEAGASEYCAWSGGRIPTAVEWEYAARNAGNDVIFPWGDEPALCSDIGELAFGVDGCNGEPDVGCRHARDITAQGICDLVGNFAEWVARVDPSGASKRGHSYAEESDATTLGGGDALYTPGGETTLGFRCVR